MYIYTIRIQCTEAERSDRLAVDAAALSVYERILRYDQPSISRARQKANEYSLALIPPSGGMSGLLSLCRPFMEPIVKSDFAITIAESFLPPSFARRSFDDLSRALVNVSRHTGSPTPCGDPYRSRIFTRTSVALDDGRSEESVHSPIDPKSAGSCKVFTLVYTFRALHHGPIGT